MTRRFTALALASAMLLTGCGQDRAAADDPDFHAAVAGGRDGTEVTFDARLLAEPVASGEHERLQVKAATGERLEIDHNTRLATWVPAHTSDQLVVHGKLYVDPTGTGVHCTHAHTSRGCPAPGWIMLAGRYYE